jgi:hypothetical protein
MTPTDTLPGISDHDIVYSEFDFKPVIHRQKPRSIPLYNKADWDSIRLDMMNLLKDLTDMFNCKLVRSEGGPLGERRFKLLVQNVGFCCRITVQFTI